MPATIPRLGRHAGAPGVLTLPLRRRYHVELHHHLIADQVVRPEAWAAELAKTDEPVILLGSGALAYRQIFSEALGDRATWLPAILGHPRAAFVGVLGSGGEPLRFEAPTGLAFAGGRLYVTDMLAGKVLAYDVEGAL